MVVSKLDKAISYPEIKSIMGDDRESTVELFLIEARSIEIVVAIGKQIETYKSKKVVYHPIYMIKNKFEFLFLFNVVVLSYFNDIYHLYTN